MPLKPWTIAIALLVAAAYIVPYLLSAVETWTGAFLFWLAFAAATWLVLVLTVARWNVDARPGREERR